MNGRFFHKLPLVAIIDRPFYIMIKLIFIFSLAIFLSSCRNTCEQLGTNQFSKGLFLERYKTYDAGVWGELIECYITDSFTFRQKIGSYDEHEFFHAKLDGDKIVAYNIESSRYADTTERKSISKIDLLQKQQTDRHCLSTIPIFGTNSIKCDSIITPAGSYKTADGYYISQVQHHCGNDFLNAVYYTDSVKFSIFIGVYNPGSLTNNYSVKLDSTGTFNFYSIEYKNKADTIKTKTYLLADLKKGSLIKVCN